MNFQEQLMGVFQTLLIGLLNVGAGYALYLLKVYVEKLKVQSQKIQNEDQRALADSTISRLSDLVKVSVTAMEETVGKNLKQLFADNKIDKQEILDLATTVRDEIYGQLSEEAKSVLSSEVGDIQVYIEKLIENALKDIKAK